MSIPVRRATSRTEPLIAGLDALLRGVVALVWLNLWWTLLTLLGGIVLGIGPATVAAHTVATRWLRGDHELPVARTMITQWRAGWRRAAPPGMVCLLLVISLVSTWMISRGQPAVPAAVTQGIVLLIVLLLLCTLPHLAWVLARTAGEPAVGDPVAEEATAGDATAPHRPLRTSQVFAAAFAVGIGRPVLTLVLLLLGIGWPVLLVAAGWPGLLPLCGASVPIAAGAWCVRRAVPSSTSDPDPSTA